MNVPELFDANLDIRQQYFGGGIDFLRPRNPIVTYSAGPSLYSERRKRRTMSHSDCTGNKSEGSIREDTRRAVLRPRKIESHMNVLVVDVGGTHVKILATGQKVHRQFDSGPKLTPGKMVAEVRKLASGWKYDHVSIGYPGPVLAGRPILEPVGRFQFQVCLQAPRKTCQ
jgi:hypothetical protein